ncbi:peptidase S14 [Bradyrhizobium erythrophlei]|nr:peptidase S14 [Bradyrhizobium erythrophlei]
MADDRAPRPGSVSVARRIVIYRHGICMWGGDHNHHDRIDRWNQRPASYRLQVAGDQPSGVVDYNMYTAFRTQFDNAADKDLVVIELSTLGGDPEVARMMGEDVRFASETEPQRRFVFLGKAVIYSAGVTFMSFFARSNRYHARGTRLMIHERKLSKSLVIDGPLTTCIAVVRATLNEIECSIAMQNEGFENLILGSNVTIDEVMQKAPSNWYLEAQEAKTLGLIETVL